MRLYQAYPSVVTLVLGLIVVPGWFAYAQPLQLSPTPDEALQATPTQSTSQPNLQDPANNLPPVKLEARMQGITKATIFQQLQPQHYLKYEEKTKSLKRSLHEALAYLDSLKGEPPSLQRLSAFSAEAWMDWSLLEDAITPEESQYASYRLMKEAVQELRSLTQYWVTTERTRRLFRGTLREAQADQAILQAKREKISATLKELAKFEKLKEDLKAETAY